MSLEKVYKARKTPSLKRGLMKRGYICLIVVLVLFAVAAAADTNLQDTCRTTDDCIYLCEDLLGLSSDCYCQQGFCYLRSASGSSVSNVSSNLTTNTTIKNAAGNYPCHKPEKRRRKNNGKKYPKSLVSPEFGKFYFYLREIQIVKLHFIF